MRLALIEDDRAPAELQANPVRQGLTRDGRVVTIRFTEFGQARSRVLTLFGPSPEETARHLLDETRLAPRDVKVKTQALGDVAVLRSMPLTAPPELLPGTVQPIAFIDGFTTDELASALAALASAWPTPFNREERP